MCHRQLRKTLEDVQGFANDHAAILINTHVSLLLQTIAPAAKKKENETRVATTGTDLVLHNLQLPRHGP